MHEDTQSNLRGVIAGLDQIIANIKAEAEKVGINPYLLKTPEGQFAMGAPFIAKANAETALAALERPVSEDWTEAVGRKHAAARWGVPGYGLRAQGRVIGYSPNPMVLIETDDGEQVWWAAELCDVVDAERLVP